MINRKLLFSVFNTVLKSYSSKLVSVNCKRSLIISSSHDQLIILNSPKKTNTIVFSNNFTTHNDVVSFDELKSLSQKSIKDVLLIDVREPLELQETGQIPGSINIPLNDVEETFRNMPNEEFLKRFNRTKPANDTAIVVSCLMGKRSAKAQNIIQQLGYTNVRNYLGGWTEWIEKSQKN